MKQYSRKEVIKRLKSKVAKVLPLWRQAPAPGFQPGSKKREGLTSSLFSTQGFTACTASVPFRAGWPMERERRLLELGEKHILPS